MGRGYALAYRLGITPWERAGRAATMQANALLDREQEAGATQGRALDIGCGSGDHTIELARRGWIVTGIDTAGTALDQARAKAAAEGVDVTFLDADVTCMRDRVGEAYRFVLDIGCFHGLKPRQREAYAREVDAVTAPGATLLMLAFQPGHRLPVIPRGASAQDILGAFRGWTVVDEDVADTTGMPGPLKRTAPRFYRLRRD